ncbi:ferric reductase-like transmembrane domain-containing protein [Actinomycetospora sp.]|uniref:ferric reductase-like transmembrane domain-containing protein n=1 Tax=Actinomycetospora sp. TaxID=1872135 RepID=UPI002F423EF3
MLQLWFLSRALGAMALLLFSLVMVLGILHNTSVVKNAELGLPRFVLVALHRNLSLISLVFIALHVITVIVTDYVHLRVIDVFVPGIAPFNPIAAALGTVATDLLIAITVTSMLRQRISRRVWIWVHWTSYLCWPVAVVHAVLNVIPRGTTWWTLVIPLVSMIAIIVALVYRLRDRRRGSMPVAERGKVTEEAIRQVTGELPIARPSARPDGPDAATEVMAPAPVAAPAGPGPGGRHRAPGEDSLEAATEVMPPAGRSQRGVVPLEPRSSRR